MAVGGLENVLQIFEIGDWAMPPKDLGGLSHYSSSTSGNLNSGSSSSSSRGGGQRGSGGHGGGYEALPGDGLPSQPCLELEGHTSYISSVRFPEPGRVLTASGDGTCRLWDAVKGKCIRTFDGHEGDVMALACNIEYPAEFLSCSVDATCRYWDVREPPHMGRVFEGHESDINAVHFFPNAEAFSTGAQ